MKIATARSLVLLSMIVLFSRCDYNSSDRKEINTTNGMMTVQKAAHELGRLHNAGLDHMLQQMKNRKTPFKNRSDAIAFFRKSAEGFIHTESEDTDDVRIGNFIDMDRIFPAEGKNPRRSINPIQRSSLDLTPQQMDQIAALFAVFKHQTEEEGFFNQDYSRKLDHITQNLDASFSQTELMVIFGVKEILAASVDYWNEKRSVWISEIIRLHNGLAPETARALQKELAVATPCAAFPSLPLCHAINWNEVAQEDGGGLIIASIDLAIVAIVSGPPGWATSILMVAGGTAGASAVEIYNQVMELM